jgi:hypothetical protein
MGGSQPKDAYESRFVKAQGVALHRDKHVAKGAVLAMVPMAIIALIVTIAVAMGADPAAPPALAVVPGLWFAWTLYMILTKVSVRTVLTRDMLEVHWGLSVTKVPTAAITHCEIQQYDRGLPQATSAMKMWGPKGWVLVRWTDDDGKDKTAHFPAGDPATLVEHIQRTRSSEAGKSAGLRLADDADGLDAAALAEVEALAEADADARAETKHS